MKILHVISSYNGGIYTFIKRKYPYLKTHASEFHVLAFEEPSASVLEAAKEYNVTFFKSHNPKKKGYRTFFNKLRVLIKKEEYDVIHCHLNGHRALPYFLLSKWHHVPFMIHAHNAGETADSHKQTKESVRVKFNQWLNRQMTKYPTSCGEEASAYIFGNDELKHAVKWLPNSLDPEKFLTNESADIKALRQSINLPEEKIIIGQVGRLDFNKNQLFTVEIAHELAEMSNEYHWIIIGEGKNRIKIEDLIETYDLSECVQLLGRKENVEDYYKAMDILIFPSYNEGFGMVAVEAQTSGTQVLASDTLSREIDLDLGLISYLPLGDKQQWVNEIRSRQASFINQDEILTQLKEKKLTDEQAADLYFSYVNKINNEGGNNG